MFIDQGYQANKVLYFCGVSSSTWYKSLKLKTTSVKKVNRGHPIPGYTFSQTGFLIMDSSIVEALKKIQSRNFFKNGGGYH